jgi:hypothetical protein
VERGVSSLMMHQLWTIVQEWGALAVRRTGIIRLAQKGYGGWGRWRV